MAYPTALSQYGQECVDEELTIEKRASKLMKDLNQLDLSKPTIFVGHSMGGLLIKSIITQASTVPDYASIIESIRGFVFYSTPHFGSFLASAASAPVFKNVLLPSPDVTSLKKQSSYLQKLNRDFLELVQKQKIDILSFYEELPTKIALKDVIVVEQDSANLGSGTMIGVEENHQNINKPTNRSDSAYSNFVNFILKVL